MSSRQCGNCGADVGANDITCPRCDALLAAYEAPAGSIASTDIATQPVDMTETHVPSPTIDPVEIPDVPRTAPEPPPPPTIPAPAETTIPASATTSPTAEALETFREERAERPSFSLPRQSPIARAMEETKAAVDATPQPTSEAEREAIASIMKSADDILEDRQDALNVPEEFREDVDLEDLVEPGPDDDDEPDAPGGTSTSGAAPRSTPTAKPARPARQRPPASKSTVVEKVRAQAASGWYGEDARQQSRRPRQDDREQRRTTSQERAAQRRHPDRPRLPGSGGEGQSPYSGALVGYGIIALVVIIVLGRAMPGTFAVPVLIIGLIWFMSSLSKSTGRKSTSIPNDRFPR